MPEPAWLIYTGAITGVIGTITGIAGAVMGYISYRRSGELKALDLRLELRKAESNARIQLAELPALIGRAANSRAAVASAVGSYHSGAMEVWNREVDEDLIKIADLEKQIPSPPPQYAGLSHGEIETKLVAIHELLSVIGRLSDKYHAEITSDDRERQQIRADVRARLI